MVNGSILAAKRYTPSGSTPVLMLDCRSGMDVGTGSVHAEVGSDTLRVAAHSTQSSPHGLGDSCNLRAGRESNGSMIDNWGA